MSFQFIAVCLLLPVCLYHPAFCHGIHLSSSLFSADGATWQGHRSQSIPTLSSAGISICHSALPSRLGVACWRETSLCVCVLGERGEGRGDGWSKDELALSPFSSSLSSTCQSQSYCHGEDLKNITTLPPKWQLLSPGDGKWQLTEANLRSGITDNW